MKLALKGIIDDNLLELAASLGFEVVSFDFRPKSFNFTQAYKVKQMIDHFDQIPDVTLIFENEKDFVVSQLQSELPSHAWLEFTGQSSLDELDKLRTSFVWKYDEKEPLSAVKKSHHLKRILFTHQQVEYYFSRGELVPLIELLRAEIGAEIEISSDWDGALMLSLFEAVKIDCLSFEINNKVEKSYRNIDQELIKLHMVHVNEMLGELKT